MATVTSIASGAWHADAASVWDTGTIPGTTDDAVLNGHSVTVDDDITIGSLSALQASTLITGAQNIVIQGAGGLNTANALDINAGATTWTVTSGFDLDGGTMTFTGDNTITGDISVGGGTFDTNGNELFCNGNVAYVSGSTTELNLTLTNTGTLAWAVLGAGPITHLTTSAGITTTLTNTVYCNAYTGGGNITGAELLVNPAANNWWGVQVGTVTMSSFFSILNCDFSPGNDITLAVVMCKIATLATHSFAFDANLTNAGPLRIDGTGVNDIMTVDMAGNGLSCTAVTLGHASNNASGVLLLGTGVHTISSLGAGNGTNAANVLNFGSSKVNLSGTIEGATIAEVNTAGTVIGGTINDVDVSGSNPLLHLFPAGAGSGNTDVTELTPPLGGQATAGVSVAV